MTKRRRIMILLLLSLFLVSCIETQQIEKLGIINAVGVDTADNNLLELTLVIFQFTPQSKEVSKIILGKGNTVKGAGEDAVHESVYKLASGKLKVTLFGKEMAEKGILPLLDTNARDARIPDLMYLAVSKTTAKEILSIKEDELRIDTGQYLNGLIENHSTDHNVPRKTIQDFLRIYYDIGQDNVLPLFEIQDNLPKLNGLAVFKGDQMVGELTNKETILINLMDRTVKEQLMSLSLPIEPFTDHLEEREGRPRDKDVNLALMISNGKSKTTMLDKEGLTFQTDTTIDLRLVEQSAGIVLQKKKVVELLEKEVEKKLESQFKKLLTKLQDLEADPFGYGLYYKSSEKGKDLTNEEWREKFPTIDVTFNVNVDIINHGVID